ncbi:CRISPR system precrRNA processing endoribonuclease RAMP protein Cas6 [Xylanibacter muris]|uniref:CRISPR system precrRNA processing endoribonuclease RAMP protein Cas6 n=1 Tax=Xylanibacter muris TaxID=2736290 RepID=A0ABX2ANH3_9BACT|nr:CRISPR system precrRNA processing endoribonuclease RAMP protein Cas6 [Xylanibacter muris]NPD92734.1 CRISPR system precrRNA processing endoribonuclease RAMP protein Cas6 [Xylanibacter muris]
MEGIFELVKGLYYHRFEVCFKPADDISVSSWSGAVLRNRFLYSAENVFVEPGISLRQWLDTLPLPGSHSLYKHLAGGFPKGFLFDCSTLPFKGGFTVKKNKTYSFGMILIGKCAEKAPLFAEALKIMFSEGWGTPPVPSCLTGITECMGGRTLPLFNLETDNRNDVILALEFKTPVNLINRPSQRNHEGYQGKLNCFPSFYQFVRSIMYRLVTLNILYTDNVKDMNPKEIKERIETFIRTASDAMLLSADIRYEKRHSTPRMDARNVYVMCGYCGTMVYGNVDSRFVPLVSFASELGVGNDINFGLGTFGVEYK